MQAYRITVIALSVLVSYVHMAAGHVTPIHGLSNKTGDTAVLACEIDGFQPFDTFSWYRDSKLIQDTPVEEGEAPKYVVSYLELSLTVNEVEASDVGDYICLFVHDNNNFSAVVELRAVPRIRNKDTSSKNLVEDDSLVLECKTWGFPTVNVRWSRDGEVLNATHDERVTFSSYTDEETGFTANDAKLRIEQITFDDRAHYECLAYNDAGINSHTTLVRVKDKLAALWPILGVIGAVVVILGIIIFIYVKKRAK